MAAAPVWAFTAARHREHAAATHAHVCGSQGLEQRKRLAAPVLISSDRVPDAEPDAIVTDPQPLELRDSTQAFC